MWKLILLAWVTGLQAGVHRVEIMRSAGPIVGPHSKPWMACLYSKSKKRQWCGAFLVQENFVMTAAHCSENPTDLMVILGMHNVKRPDSSWQTFENVRPHHYKTLNRTTYENDIVMLELEHPAILNEAVQVIPLPDSDRDIPPGTECNVAGWGTIGNSTKPSDVLREVNVTVLSNEECADDLVLQAAFLDKMLCAGEPMELNDASKYDSGGPLVCNGVAEGIVCGGTMLSPPGIYTRISKYLPWIWKTLLGS